MSRAEYNPREDYVGDGTLAAYEFDFKITHLNQLLIKVYNADGELQFAVDGEDTSELASASFNYPAAGGEIVLADNLPDGYFLVILLNPAFDQPHRYRDAGDFSLSQIESSLDYLQAQIQRLKYLQSRSLALSDSRVDAFTTDDIVPRAGAVPIVNSDNDGFEMLLTSEFVPTIIIAAGAPAADLGINGSVYINTTNSDMYKKVGGSWVLQGSIQGIQGPQGDPGPAGNDGADGASAVPVDNGTMGAPVAIAEGGQIPFSSSDYFNTLYVVGNGAARTTTDIAAPDAKSKRLTIIGTSDINTLQISDGANIALEGPCVLGEGQMLNLFASSDLIWLEESRSR